MYLEKPQFFTKTSSAWEAMLSVCREAKTSIDMEQYIFTNDAIGKKFLEIFVQKQKTGVKVRLICDTVGSYYFYNSPAPVNLRAIGIEIRFFNIINPWRIKNIFSGYFRDHRKILIIDGKTAFIGGSGIRIDMENWRDTNVKVEGDMAQEIQNTFEEMWSLSLQKNIFSRIRKFGKYSLGFNLITNAPYPRRRFLYHRLIEAIQGSKEYVYLTTPYFVPNKRLITTLRAAVKRNVDVRVLVPKTSDWVLVNRASHSFFEELLSSGVRIYQHSGDFLHAKTAVVDGKWSTLGSFNFDNLSFSYNHEANIVTDNPIFVSTLKNHFELDISRSEEVSLNKWLQRPFLWKIREFFIKAIRRFL